MIRNANPELPFGIDPSRIVDRKEIAEHFLCPICQYLLVDPVCCSQCKNNFCKPCLDTWIRRQGQTRSICPNRCINFYKQKAPPIVKSMLSQLKLKCTFEPNGCQEAINYDTLTKHEQTCGYRGSTCTGCGKLFIAKELMEHEKWCEGVLVTCELCQLVLKRKEYLIHVKEKLTCMSVKMEKMRMASEEQMRKVAEQMAEIRNMHEKQMNELRQNNQELIPTLRLITSDLHLLRVGAGICDRGHKLQYYSIMSRNYSGKNFKCNQCEKPKSGASLHCPNCRYDICQDCNPPHYSKGLCLNNHQLESLKKSAFHMENSLLCDKCRSTLNEEYVKTCCSCKFFLCTQCNNGMRGSMLYNIA